MVQDLLGFKVYSLKHIFLDIGYGIYDITGSFHANSGSVTTTIRPD